MSIIVSFEKQGTWKIENNLEINDNLEGEDSETLSFELIWISQEWKEKEYHRIQREIIVTKRRGKSRRI